MLLKWPCFVKDARYSSYNTDYIRWWLHAHKKTFSLTAHRKIRIHNTFFHSIYITHTMFDHGTINHQRKRIEPKRKRLVRNFKILHRKSLNYHTHTSIMPDSAFPDGESWPKSCIAVLTHRSVTKRCKLSYVDNNEKKNAIRTGGECIISVGRPFCISAGWTPFYLRCAHNNRVWPFHGNLLG